MSVEWRGGQPTTIRFTVPTSPGILIQAPGRTSPRVQGGSLVTGFVPRGTSKWVRLRNFGTSGQNVRVFFDPADFAANNNNYMVLLPNDIIREPMEVDQLWFISESGTPTVEFTIMNLRG